MQETEQEWFKEWFDSPFYPVLYNNRHEEEASDFISRMIPELHLEPGARVLDAGCGSGRHSRFLAEMGLKVTGIDLSPASIARARQQYGKLADFEVWDMRKVFAPSKFDLVANLFSSFGYFAEDHENRAVLNALSLNLKQNGLLVLDYLNSEYVVRNLVKREITEKGGIQFHITRKLEKGGVIKDIRFLHQGTDYHYQERVRLYNRTEIISMMADVGLVVEQCWGDYHLHAFQSAQSSRLILVARKKLG